MKWEGRKEQKPASTVADWDFGRTEKRQDRIETSFQPRFGIKPLEAFGVRNSRSRHTNESKRVMAQ